MFLNPGAAANVGGNGFVFAGDYFQTTNFNEDDDVKPPRLIQDFDGHGILKCADSEYLPLQRVLPKATNVRQFGSESCNHPM